MVHRFAPEQHIDPRVCRSFERGRTRLTVPKSAGCRPYQEAGSAVGGSLALQDSMRLVIFALSVVVAAPSTVVAQHTLRDQVLTAGISEEVVVADHPTLPLRELTSTSGAVVHVTIRRSTAFLSTDGASVQTDYKAVVVDVVKPSEATRLFVGDEITIRRVGGVMNLEGRTLYSNEAGFPPFAAASGVCAVSQDAARTTVRARHRTALRISRAGRSHRVRRPESGRRHDPDVGLRSRDS